MNPSALIDVRQVGKRFGRVQALDAVSLSIAPGERVAFVGANGSGKTTLMRAVMGLLDVVGEVYVGGHDVRRHPERALAEVAYIPQVAPPLDAPVRELVRATAALRGHAPQRTAERAADLGLDFDRIAASRLRDLSGGTKQKLLAAMALAADARILICDEPTANLDEAARQAFFRQVARRPADAALILCSHRTEEVQRLVDRVVELSEGRLVRDARLAEVLAERALCRVDLRLAPGVGDELPRALGYAPLGGDRWRRHLTPGQKLEHLATLMIHRAELADLHLADEEAFDAHPQETTP